ncbi:hypothetical protein RUND412_001979 [Rhizina undulata]
MSVHDGMGKLNEQLIAMGVQKRGQQAAAKKPPPPQTTQKKPPPANTPALASSKRQQAHQKRGQQVAAKNPPLGLLTAHHRYLQTHPACKCSATASAPEARPTACEPAFADQFRTFSQTHLYRAHLHKPLCTEPSLKATPEREPTSTPQANAPQQKRGQQAPAQQEPVQHTTQPNHQRPTTELGPTTVIGAYGHLTFSTVQSSLFS